MDDEYSRHNRENLPLPIPMQLSKKPKLFSCNVIEFLEFTLNFEHFEKKKKKKKNESHSLSISEIIDFNRRGYLRSCF